MLTQWFTPDDCNNYSLARIEEPFKAHGKIGVGPVFLSKDAVLSKCLETLIKYHVGKNTFIYIIMYIFVPKYIFCFY